MSNRARYGFWTCATVYAAIGVIGVFFFSARPGASLAEGYGTFHVIAQK